MLLLPDTPRWYFAKGHLDEGDKVLSRLHGKPVDDEAVQRQRAEIMASIELEEQEKNKFNIIHLIWDTSDIRAGRRIRIAFLILSIQQMMGRSHFLGPIEVANNRRNKSYGVLQHFDILRSWYLELHLTTPCRRHEHLFRRRHILPPANNRAFWSPSNTHLDCVWLHDMYADLRHHDWTAQPYSEDAVDGSGICHYL